MTVGRQLMEAYRLHRRGSAHNEALVRVQAVFDLIGVPRGRSTPIHTNFPADAPARDDRAQPLARARISDRRRPLPLDVLVQDQILGEIDALRKRMGLSLILISHDIGAVAETCSRVAVMYAGEIVELAPTETIFERACHPIPRRCWRRCLR